MTQLEVRLKSIAERVGGTMGFAVRNEATGEEARLRADEIFPTASVFKIPLLVFLYALAEQGRIDLDARVSLSESDVVPGSGVLKELAPGLRPTVRDLAKLMIVVSDNLATDAIWSLVNGGSAVTDFIQGFGLRKTSVPWNTGDLLSLVVGIDPPYSRRESYERVTEKLLHLDYDRSGNGFQCDDRNNVTTPAEMMELLTLIMRREIVSPAACEEMLDILRAQQSNDRIPLYLPRPWNVAHKTGTIGPIRCDAGIIFMPRGAAVVFCAFAKDVPVEEWVACDRAMAEAALAAYESFMP